VSKREADFCHEGHEGHEVIRVRGVAMSILRGMPESISACERSAGARIGENIARDSGDSEKRAKAHAWPGVPLSVSLSQFLMSLKRSFCVTTDTIGHTMAR